MKEERSYYTEELKYTHRTLLYKVIYKNFRVQEINKLLSED